MTFTAIAREGNLLGIAQCTNPLAVGGRCPFIRANVGAVSTQAYTDPGLGPLAIELLTMGHSPEKVLKELSETDPGFAWRQIGIVDRHGRAAVHTGDSNKDYKGSITGDGYLVMGNYLKSDRVVKDMNEAFLASKGKILEDRLLAAITAGRDAGGDLGGQRSSVILVYDTEAYARTDLRVDWAPGPEDAIVGMTKLLDLWRPLIPYYKERPHKPEMEGWEDWLKKQQAS
ncbi:DUF1028 domain-containing protein [Hyphomicrobium sp. CS1BSMeth3]|uniref:DUF1028 domain-containing protein n=1 Tax=Hyphomicrobium sp. CS1BSMeth3 TaxID=1892844 RepID=UPI0009301889|nr:DUF1028 domain-containing protein [Hyphomicrobium sp. CS1BSMeth3]